MTINFAQPTPILRMFDAEKAREFYVDYLGFDIRWEHRFDKNLPLYMEIARDGCVLHLSEHHGDCTPVSALRIEVSDARKLHEELQGKNYRHLNPGYDAEEKQISLIDPFGNRLIFFEANPSRAPIGDER